MSVCGISTPFGELSPTVGQIPTCSSAVRHSAPEGAACDLHALGTPPAFVLSQDQTLHCVDWKATARPNRTRAKRKAQKTTGITCASSRFSCEGTKAEGLGVAALRRTKNQGRGAILKRRTPGDVSSRKASAVRKKGQPKPPKLLRLPPETGVRRRPEQRCVV